MLFLRVTNFEAVSYVDISSLDDEASGPLITAPPRVTISENFASHAAVQELVDVKPD